MDLSNGIITKMVVKSDHAWSKSDGWDSELRQFHSCKDHSIGNFLHVQVDTSQAQYCVPLDLVDGSIFYELCELNIVSKTTPQDVWKVVKQWSFAGKMIVLKVTMETYSETEHEYDVDERVKFRKIILKNTGDVNFIKRLVSRRYTRVLHLEDCKTEFQLEHNGLKAFGCFSKEAVNIDHILQQQTCLSCVFLNNVAITEALLRLLGANRLNTFHILYCHIEGDINNEMFSFVKGITSIGFQYNPVPLSAFMWNNLQNVKELCVGLKEATGLEKKKLESLNSISYGPEKETKGIVKKLLDSCCVVSSLE